MKSTTGKHFVGLDHIRAVAAFIVVSYHFTQAYQTQPAFPEFLPLSIIRQGHTGVALFMVLSGYLFAKLLDGRRVSYAAFLYNRALRLLPLLTLVVGLYWVAAWYSGDDMAAYSISIVKGLVMPTLPGTAWSLTVEFHFYLLLPLLLALLARSPMWLVALWGAAVAVRYAIFQWQGTVADAAYWTMFGRIDQFLAGILAFHLLAARKIHWCFPTAATILLIVLWSWFSNEGGVLGWPGGKRVDQEWIWIPVVEAASYAFIVAWYDGKQVTLRTTTSRFLAVIGTYSYSIYLIHLPLARPLWRFVYGIGIDLRVFELSFLLSIPFFAAMVLIGHFSYRWIESPFLHMRCNYILKPSLLRDQRLNAGADA